MNGIIYRKSTINKINEMINTYVSTLTGIGEDYWEEHIFDAEMEVIEHSGRAIGFYTLYNNEKITSFWVEPAHLFRAQDIFLDILKQKKVKTAYVSTCDELFLSLCLDYHKRVEMEAYFFDGTVKHTVREPEFSRECLSKIQPQEIEEVNKETDSFFDTFKPEDLENGSVIIYRFSKDRETLGYGIIVPVKLMPDKWSCGMITLPAHRQKGVGRSIQLHLADICKENGKVPVSGCWYHNPLSKKTIESAGRYTKTRLLNVHFTDD